MNKGVKIALGIIGILGIGTGIYFIFKDTKKKKKTNGNGNGDKKDNTSGGGSLYKAETDPLSKYDKGDNVKCLQALLNFWNASSVTSDWGTKLDVDGYYGPKTEAMVDKAVADTTSTGLGEKPIKYSKIQSSLLTAVAFQAEESLRLGQPVLLDELAKLTSTCASASCCVTPPPLSFAGRGRTRESGNFSRNTETNWFNE